MARITIRLPDDLDDRVEDYVGYGSKSEFYRQAAEEKLAREEDDQREAVVDK
jgi:Arc/MetJ-type ribon-helix-helix transcriptional regulator